MFYYFKILYIIRLLKSVRRLASRNLGCNNQNLVVVHSYGRKLNISRFPKHIEMALLDSYLKKARTFWPAVNIYLIGELLLLITSEKLISFFINVAHRQDEHVNIKCSIYFVMVLLVWSLVVLFSHLQYLFTQSQYSFAHSQYPFVHPQYSSVHSQYSQYRLSVFL